MDFMRWEDRVSLETFAHLVVLDLELVKFRDGEPFIKNISSLNFSDHLSQGKYLFFFDGISGSVSFIKVGVSDSFQAANLSAMLVVEFFDSFGEFSLSHSILAGSCFQGLRVEVRLRADLIWHKFSLLLKFIFSRVKVGPG